MWNHQGLVDRVEWFDVRHNQIRRQVHDRLAAFLVAKVRAIRLMLLTPIEKRIDNRRHREARDGYLPRLSKKLPVLLKRGS